MAKRSSNEIVCDACGEDTLARKEPVFDGFTKVGEQYVCVSCGHEYPSEADTPFKDARRDPKLFSDDEKARKVEIFDDSEKGRFCRHCTYYVVNPFVQRCDLHNKFVEATDVCDRFNRKPESESDDDDDGPSLADLF